MKRRFLAFLLMVAVALLIFPFSVLADVIVEPVNDFFSKHRDECTPLNRSFYANSENGFVSFKKEPGSRKEILGITNGEVIYIMFTYDRKGETWGVAEVRDEDEPYSEWQNGWVPMKDLLLKYDYISFDEEHQDEFYEYTGGYDMLYETEDIIFWTWPGSGEIAWTLQKEQRDDEADANFLETYIAYKDDEGREWGYFSYVYGIRNTWVCLSDPGNTDIPGFNTPPEPELWEPKAVEPSGGISMIALTIILVAVLTAGTAVLIRLFWKPKK